MTLFRNLLFTKLKLSIEELSQFSDVSNNKHSLDRKAESSVKTLLKMTPEQIEALQEQAARLQR